MQTVLDNGGICMTNMSQLLVIMAVFGFLVNNKIMQNEEYDYYRVGVAKKSYTDVYIRVPKGETVTFRDRKLVKEATVKTIDRYGWDDYGWEDDLDIDEVASVDEKEAIVYKFYDAYDFKS